MSEAEVCVLWMVLERPEDFKWMMADAPPGLRVTRVDPAALGQAVPVARARGPVVAVVYGDRDAHRALALGVDEVVRLSLGSADVLTSAATSARARALSRDVAIAGPVQPGPTMELLAASVAHRLASPLALASLNVEVLRGALGPLTRLADAYATNAATTQSLPDSEAQHVVAMRASAPGSAELATRVNDLSVSLREATSAVAQAYSLVVDHGSDEVCDLSGIVAEVTQLVSVVIERAAAVRVELPSDRKFTARIPRSMVVQTLSVLLANALYALRDRPSRGLIVVRVEPRVSAAILEVTDNGVGMSAEALARAFDPAKHSDPNRPAKGTSLAVIADRLRRAGCEIVLESEPGSGTTARVFVPLLLEPETRDPASN